MISFSDVLYFVQISKGKTFFKCWYEVCLDLVLVGYSLLAMLSWVSIYKLNLEASGLHCVLLEGDTSQFMVSDGLYFSSKCLLNGDAKYLYYFPYFLTLQMLTFLALHVIWMKLPQVSSKLDLYDQLFCRTAQLKPNFEFRAASMMPSFITNSDIQEVVRIIYDQFIFLLTEKSHVKKLYICKNILMMILTIAYLTCSILWNKKIIINNFNFSCDINDGTYIRIFPPIVCTFSEKLELFGYFFISLLFLWLILGFLSVSIWNLIVLKKSSFIGDILGDDNDRVSSLKGYDDFELFITFHKKNIKDGGYFLEMLKFVFKIQAQDQLGFQPVNIKNELKNRPKCNSFEMELHILNDILLKLDLETKISTYSIDHLFQFLEETIKVGNKIQMFENVTIKQLIFQELKNNALYYGYLLKGRIYQDMKEQKKLLIEYQTYLEELNAGKVWPNNIVLAAAANVFNLRIYLIRISPISENYLQNLTLYQPLSTSWRGKVMIFSLICPNYYNLLIPKEESSFLGLSNREKFFNDQNFREKLVRKARKDVTEGICKTSSKENIYYETPSFELGKILGSNKCGEIQQNKRNKLFQDNLEIARYRVAFLPNNYQPEIRNDPFPKNNSKTNLLNKIDNKKNSITQSSAQLPDYM